MRNLFQLIGKKSALVAIAILCVTSLFSQSGPNPPEITSDPADILVECDEDVVGRLNNWLRVERGGFNATNVIQFRTTVSIEDARTILDSLRSNECTPSNMSIPVGFYGVNTTSTSDTLFANFRFQDTNGEPLDTLAPTDLSLKCSPQAENMMINWIRNGGNAVVNDACRGAIIWSDFEWSSGTRGGRGNNVSGPFDDIINEAMCNQEINFTFEGRSSCDEMTITQSATFALSLDSTEILIDALPSDLEVNCTEDIEAAILSWHMDDGGARASSLSSSVSISSLISLDSILNSSRAFRATGCDNYEVEVGFIAMDTFMMSSDTLAAAIRVIDNVAPGVMSPSRDTTLICRDNNIESVLEEWIKSRGGATASDNCSDTVIWTTFSWTGDGRNNQGDINSGPFDNIFNQNSCAQSYAFTFIVEDVCGNSSQATANFSILDTAIMVVAPATSVSLPCDRFPNPSASITDWYNQGAQFRAEALGERLTTRATKSLSEVLSDFDASLMDGCSEGIVEVGFYAMDDLGVSSDTSTASFMIIDEMPPTITVEPTDLVFDCVQVDSNMVKDWILSYGGAEASDACSDSVIWTSFSWTSSTGAAGSGDFLDGPFTIIDGTDCFESATVTFFTSDLCGNSTAATASFSIRDTTPLMDMVAPVITQNPSDASVDCSMDIADSLMTWYDSFGGLQATDDNGVVKLRATKSFVLAQQDFNASNTQSNCASGSVEVGFFALDTLDNSSDTVFAVFSVVDTIPPTISVEAQDITVSCDVGRQDSLTNWIKRIGGAMAIDDCSVDDIIWAEFGYRDTEGNTGSGTFLNGPFNILGENLCDWSVTVNFIVTDACGNTSSTEASFALIDDVAPVFPFILADTTLNCDNVPSATAIVADDACEGQIMVTSSDSTTQSSNDNTCEYFNYKIYRTYSVSDQCGNEDSFVQLITISDTLEPRYTAPADITISCLDDTNPMITGSPVNIKDNCGSEVIITFSDSPVGEGCDMQIIRTWDIRDLCGSSLLLPQTITIRDTIAPAISKAAEDIILNCQNASDVDQAFSLWVADLAGAEAVDECDNTVTSFVAVPGSYDINDPTTFPGEAPGMLNFVECPSSELGAFRFENVDVVFVDGCDNASVTSASFKIIDDIAPSISGGLMDTTLAITDANSCSTTLFIPALSVEDACGDLDNSFSMTDRYDIKSSELGSEQIPVDSFTARFGPFDAANLDESQMIMLRVQMINIDADDPTEYFNIVAEDGTDLGRTPNTDVQCGDKDFELSFTPDQVRRWAADGFIEIDFLPNIPAGLSGALAINDVCFGAGSRILFTVDVDLAVDGFIDYKIQIDDNEPIALGSVQDYTATVETGTHTVTYLVSDCAGNVSSQSFNVTVQESTAPSVTCPDNAVSNLSLGNCSIEYTLPTAASVTDNCSLADTFFYQVSGATEIMETPFSRSQEEVLSLNKGENILTYIASDNSSNTAECTFSVTVSDIEDPVIVCRDTSIVQTHPSGILPLIVDPALVAESVSDNCEVADYDFMNTDFNCSNIGDIVQVTVIASDDSGNTSQCVSNVRITPFALEPMARSLICTGDTLKLFANVPAVDSMVYDFTWTGPNGYSSTMENPVIPNSTPNLSGEYSLVVLGANGCRSVGSVRVTIEDFNSPEVSVDKLKVCEGDTLNFRGTNYQSDVVYKWFTGRAPSGIQVGVTDVPTFSYSPSADETSFYLIAENEACETSPSGTLNIEVNPIPQLDGAMVSLQICERGSFQLRSNYEGTDATKYNWTGPNGFTSDEANPPSFDNATADLSGDYTLVVDENGCPSAPRITRVTVQDFPTTPEVRADEVVCEGSSLILFLADTSANKGTLNWLLDGEFYEAVDGNGLIIQNVGDSLQGLWQVYAQDGACTSDTSNGVLVTIESKKEVEILIDTLLCATDEVILESTVVPDATYSWSGPNNFRSNLESPLANISQGTYFLTVTTEAGCENTASIDVTTVPRPMIISFSQDEVNECVDGTSEVAISATAGPDSNYMYQWEGPNGFSQEGSTLLLTNATSAQSGTYTLLVESDICESEIGSVEVTLTDIPAQPILGENRRVCVGESLTLKIENSDSTESRYIWTTPMGMFETDVPTFEIPEIGISNAGAYLVRTDDQGCISGDSEILIVNVFSIPRAPGVSSNAPVCEGDDLILQATQILNAEYVWTGPNGFEASGDRVVVRNTDPSLEGDYSVAIILNGCPSPLSTLSDIEFLPTPVQPVTEITQLDVCVDDMASESVMLCINAPQYNPDGDYLWTNETTGEVLGRTSERCLVLSDDSPVQTGENRIIVEELNDICSSIASDAISFVLYERLDQVADGGEDVIACDISNVRLGASNPTQGIGRWTALDPDINFSDPTDPNSLVFDINEGENMLIWQLENGACIGDVDTVIVRTEFSIVANDDELQTAYNTATTFTPELNDDLTDDYEIQIISQPRAGVVTSNVDGFEFIPENGFLGPVELVYEICSITCPNNCDRATVSIEVGDVSDCFAPSLVTPNGDGINDAFVIPCIQSGLYPNNQLYIYNQYGDQVLDAPSYNNDWQGQYKGTDLPTGTYYYVFRANNQLAPEKGFIIIER